MSEYGDYIVRAVACGGYVKACAITAREMTERARQIHGATPLATAALGRSLAAASMMGSAMKEEDASLTLHIRGDGPLGFIIAVSDCEGCVRGYVKNPLADLPLRPDGKLDVGAGVGEGQLAVVKDIGLKEPFTGTVELVSGEIADDLAAYFTESEQVPSAVALGVLVARDRSVAAAGGYIIQLMPGADDEVVSKIEHGVYTAGTITSMFSKGLTPEQVLERVLGGLDMEIVGKQPVCYRCACSEEKVLRALASLTPEELKDCAADEKIEVTCQFCDKKYSFNRDNLYELLNLCQDDKK